MQRVLPSFSSPLLQRIYASEVSPPCGGSPTPILLQQAIKIINDDTQLAPENKRFIIERVLGKELTSYHYLTAKSIIETVQQGNTASTWYCHFRRGIDYLRHAGNRRRPKDRLKQRSQNQRCEITGNDEDLVLKGCRIFPFPISNEDVDNDHLWNLLRCFWDPDTVEIVKLLCGPVPINDFVNGIVMTAEAYDSFNDLGFYLIPELDTITPEKYSVIFHWTREPKRISNFWLPGCVVDDMEYFPAMESGQIIVLETVHPVLFPLPDPGLLIVRALLAWVSHPARAWIDENFGGHEPIEDDQSVSTGSSFGCVGYYSSDSNPSEDPRHECVHSTRKVSISTTPAEEMDRDGESDCSVCATKLYMQDWLDRELVMPVDIESDEEGSGTDFGEAQADLARLRVSCAIIADSVARVAQ